jgi:hypothetical protein
MDYPGFSVCSISVTALANIAHLSARNRQLSYYEWSRDKSRDTGVVNQRKSDRAMSV